MLLFVSVLLFATESAPTQDMLSLRKQAEEVVKASNPTWTLIRKEERDKEVICLWGPEKADVTLTIFYGSSEQEAINRMNFTLKFLSQGPGKKLTSLGDEAYMWDDRSGFAGIRFRKANVYVDLVAPSLAMAQEFARKLADSVSKK